MKNQYQQYMSGEITHREFYGQFVSEYIKTVVLANIPLNRLLASEDPHLNDIPLEVWDRLLFPLPVLNMTNAGMTSVNSLSVRVCVAKEAAQQLIDEYKNTSVMLQEDQNETN